MIPSKIPGLQKIFIHKNPGTYKIRILPANPISGVQYWTHEDKVVRVRGVAEVVKDYLNRSRPGEGPKQFYGYIVYNYDEESVQVWTFSQFSISRKLEEFERQTGDITSFDIEIVKSIDEGIEEYKVTMLEPSPISSHILERLALLKIDLEMLFSTIENPHPISSEVFVDVLFEPENKVTDINQVSIEEVSEPVAALVKKIKSFTTLAEYESWNANYDTELKKLGDISRHEFAIIENACLAKQEEFTNDYLLKYDK